jgi:DNA helicase II / ATP-dependent DNA helicase PcrA
MPETYQIDYENSLNPAQLEAVMFDSGPLLVIAGAGSGKTRTLTYRVARLVEQGVAPYEILLLTFTRKAAFEMQQRATMLLDARCQKVTGGTFHGFANIMLRRYAEHLGLKPGFAILDRGDAEGLISMIRKELVPPGTGSGFPRKGTLANIFSRVVNRVEDLEDILYDDYPHFISVLDEIVAINKTYQQRKMEHNFLDYDDLLVFFHALLKNHPEVRQHISASYRYVMVDEYQDTNLIQAEIVALIANQDNNVMVVGDDAQSIYAFRGAQFKNIMKFPEVFADTRIIRLEENYRSVQPILTLTNAIIERAKEKFTKTLFTNREGGQPPALVRARSENSQSRFVVEKILEFHNQGLALDEMAVLFRSGFHSFDLEIELGKQGISFIKVGGFKFMESAHIKDILAHLRVLDNPSDRVSWYRILTLLKKIGPKSAEKLYSAIQTINEGAAGLLAIKPKPVQTKPLAALLFDLNSQSKTVAAMGEAILEYYAPILREAYDDHPRRMKDLEQLVTIMDRYNELPDFLADMALEPPNTSRDNTFTEGSHNPENRLVLSTIHSAKGLEWKTVFIIFALEGRFPSMQSMRDDENIEEERRLMYVAATRAKDSLFFVYPTHIYDRASGQILFEPANFIDSLPDDILVKESTETTEDWW